MALLLPVFFIVSSMYLVRQRRKYSFPCWPISKQYVYGLLNDDKTAAWLDALEETNMFLHAKVLTPECVYPVHTAKGLLTTLKTYLEQAKASEDLFSVPLELAMFRLAAVYSKYKGVSAYVHAEFIEHSDKFARIASLRAREMILMRPQKSTILAKLLAVRTWVEHREMSLREAHPSFFWSDPKTVDDVKTVCRLVKAENLSDISLQVLETWREKFLGWQMYWSDRPNDKELPEELETLIAKLDAAIVQQLK